MDTCARPTRSCVHYARIFDLMREVRRPEGARVTLGERDPSWILRQMPLLDGN